MGKDAYEELVLWHYERLTASFNSNHVVTLQASILLKQSKNEVELRKIKQEIKPNKPLEIGRPMIPKTTKSHCFVAEA